MTILSQSNVNLVRTNMSRMERVEWDHINHEYFDQELYFRDIRPQEFGLFFVPSIIKGQQDYGNTYKFWRFFKYIFSKVVFDGEGNMPDVRDALIIQSQLIRNRHLSRREKTDLIFNHGLFK